MGRPALNKNEPVPANAMYVGDRLYLLAHGTGGTAHLAEEQAGGRAAFLEDDFEFARQMLPTSSHHDLLVESEPPQLDEVLR